MTALASNYPVDISHDRLGFAVCLALALHAAIILGISFNLEDHSFISNKLEITLAQHSSQQAPDEADFLAQSNQQGSGTLEEKAMITARERADFQDTRIQEVSPQQQVTSSEQQAATSQQLTSTSRSQQKAQLLNPQDQKEAIEERKVSELAVMQRSLEIASLEARLDIQRQAYAKRPRVRRLTSVATKQSADALYLHNWRTKIEAIGNQNYPEQARQQNIYGSLRLLVSLLPNGDVHQVRILESSGRKVLDEAAIRIVHLASPYAPFPREMSSQVDVLEIIRTWRFEQNKLTSSS
jgi:protein TonB